MPAIYLFHRRTLYGGDDLHLLALATGTARLMQLACYSVLAYHIVHHIQYNASLKASERHIISLSVSSTGFPTAATNDVLRIGLDDPTTTSNPNLDDSQNSYQALHHSNYFHAENDDIAMTNMGLPQEDVSASREDDDDATYEREQSGEQIEKRHLRSISTTATSTISPTSKSTNNNLQHNGGNQDTRIESDPEIMFLDWTRSLIEYALMDTNTADCGNSHLFPLLLMSYTASGIVFGIGSLVLLVQIYRTSSLGCPTMQRHPRTETMEQLLEWYFLPINTLHFMIFLLGVAAILMAYTYWPCEEAHQESSAENYRNPSTLFTIAWIACHLLVLISQGSEIFWNYAYTLALYVHDPYALVWRPQQRQFGGFGLGSYHNRQQQQQQSNHSNETTGSGGSSGNLVDAALRSPSYDLQHDNYHNNNNHHQNHELTEQMWADRCHSICSCIGWGTCFMFGGRELYGSGTMYYGDFARAMADYLETRGVLDVVPSDIVAGFLVLQQLQTQRRFRKRQYVLSEQMYNSSGSVVATTEGLSSERTIPPFSGTSQQTLTTQSQQPSASSLHAANSNHSDSVNNHRANIAKGNSPRGMQLQSPPKIVSANTSAQSLRLHPTTPPPAAAPARGAGGVVRVQTLGAGTMASPSVEVALNESSSSSSRSPSPPQQQQHTTPQHLLMHPSPKSMSLPPPPPALTNHLPPSNGGSTNLPRSGSGVSMDNFNPPVPARPSSSSSLGHLADASSHQTAAMRKGFTRVFSEHNHADMFILQEGARYSQFALAIYTWVLYVYSHPVSGTPRLFAKMCKSGSAVCCCSFCCDCVLQGCSFGNMAANNSNTIQSNNLHSSVNGGSPRHHSRRHRWEGDNLCQAHKNALLLTAGLENEADLVYAQFKSSFNENPYCILVDHETQAVVLAVRGTFSLEDCITDVLLEPESLEHLGEEFGFADAAKGQYCHGGVLASARNVYRDLRRHGSLEYLLDTKYPHYQLRLVGHSLGAAVTTLLGYMLKQTYPSLKCYNYSPPGCTMTWDLAVQCQTWCTSFVLDAEVVPRLSFDALEHLRDEVLELIGRIRVPKIEVARRVATKGLCGGGDRSASTTNVRNEYDVERAAAAANELDDLLRDLLLPEDEAAPSDVHLTSYRQQLEQFQEVQSARRTSRGVRRGVRMFPPGRMMHLVKTDQVKSCMVQVAKCVTCCMSNAGSQYTPVWIGNGDLDEIVITPTMGTDHFPDRMMTELRGIVEDYGLSV